MNRRGSLGAERFVILVGGGILLGLVGLVMMVEISRPPALWPLYRFSTEFSIISRQLAATGLLAGGSLIAVALLAPRLSSVARLVRPSAVAVLFVGSTVFALLTLETCLFFLYKEVQVGNYSTPSGYTFYRHYQKQMNSEGFRDLERTLEKPARTFRIMVLGDSFTFGSGVRDPNDVYPRQLESLLASMNSPVRFEVINAGKKGWNTRQEGDFLKQRGWDYSPDLIVLGYYLNDPETAASKQAVSAAAANARLLPYPYGKFLYGTSFTYYLGNRRLMAWFPSAFGYRFPWKDHDYIVQIHNEKNLSTHRRILEQLIVDVRRHESPLVILLFPHMLALRNEPYPYARMHEYVSKVAGSKGVAVVDLLEPLRKSSLERYSVSQFDGHPNAAAHRIFAENLFSTLTELELVPSSPH